MVEKDQNVLVAPTVQGEKAKNETKQMQAKNSIKILEDYCLNNSLPKPVFQTKQELKKWKVLAKVGSYENWQIHRKLSTAKGYAVYYLLTQLRGLETEIRTEKLSQENKQTSEEKSTNNLNSNLMNTARENFKKTKKESKQLTLEDTGFKLLTKSRGLETETQTEKLSKALGFGSEACKEPKKLSKNLQSSLTPGMYLSFF